MTVTTFSFTTGATVSSWTVPNHTGLVTITAIGGGGGTSVGYAVGGNGARLAGTCTLTPGTGSTQVAVGDHTHTAAAVGAAPATRTVGTTPSRLRCEDAAG